MIENRTPGAIRAFAMSDLSSRWPTSYDDFCRRFDPTKPYPRYSPPESATADAPPSPGGSCASTPPPSPPPPSYERVTTSSFDKSSGGFSTVAQSPAVRHPAKADKEKTPTLKDEIVTAPSTPYVERTCKRKMRAEVPEQNDASALKRDAHTKAEAALGRVRTASDRIFKMDVVVQKLGDALVLDKAEKTRAIAKAAALEEAVGKASDALGLARAELSARKRKVEGYSRPRRALHYIMARWEAEPSLEVEKAASRVEEAARVDSLAREEVYTAWRGACECAEKVKATTSRLRRAKHARDSAKRICVALEAAADCAAERARRAAGAVEAGRSWEEIIYQARGTGGRMDPLLALSGFAVNFERGLGSSEEVVPNTKRGRH